MSARREISVLAKEALDVQNACNLSGVVHSFAKAMSDLLAHGLSTTAANQHPVAVLYADKIASLTRVHVDYSNPVVREAYDECLFLAKKGSFS